MYVESVRELPKADLAENLCKVGSSEKVCSLGWCVAETDEVGGEVEEWEIVG
jgi:hypothetical protein